MNDALHTEHQATPIFRHTKRQDWGLAILAWERDGRRAYQFEDGELRVFARGFYAFLEEVDRPESESEPLATRLAHEVVDADSRRDLERRLAVGDPSAVFFDEQVELFRRTYPLGFADPKWKRDVRGQDVRRRLKRHRDPAIEKARAQLAAEPLDRLIAQKQFAAVIDALATVLTETDLLTEKQAAPLRDVSAEQEKAVASGIRELIHGGAPYNARLADFIKLMRQQTGSAPSWQLVTAPCALFHPEQHVCVRPASFREQAKSLAPRLAGARSPGASLYARFLAMAEHIRGKLLEQGLGTRDLMDVYDFIRVTLTPAARQQVVVMRKRKAVEREVAKASEQAA